MKGIVPQVLNKYRDGFPQGSVSVMRPGPWGNPFPINRDRTREQAVAEHRVWFPKQKHLVERLHELRGRDLVCCCKPMSCHGDFLCELANAG